MSACRVVRISLNAISWACSERPEVCEWNLSFWLRSFAPYLSRIAIAQIRREIVDPHSACKIGLDKSEPVGERKGELRDRVRAGFRDVIARDRGRVEIAHVVADEVLLDVTHHLEGELGREDAGVLPLVFLEDVRLHRAANA